MAKIVLARKWRPRQLQTLIGHPGIVRALTHALTDERLHQAYLFTGTRGVGKTTIARILAKCLNCETGITAQPCDQCSACQSIDSGCFPDLIEIDAASRTKVEDTRDLLDNVPYAPQQGRYKVYLIDEVHMLSNHSFNALLKTLEEPPAHVIFLLATTDPEKLPATILSRCLHFHLKPLVPEQIAQQLQMILSAENITFEAAALDLLAQAANGSVRDALSLLEQAIAFGNGSVNVKTVEELLGDVAQIDILTFLQHLQKNDHRLLLNIVEQWASHGVEFSQVIARLLEMLQNIALQQIVPDAHPSNMETTKPIQALAKEWSSEIVQLYYQILLIGARDLGLAPNQKSGFIMLVLRLIAFTPDSLSPPKSTAKTPMPLEAKIQPTTTITAPPPKIPPIIAENKIMHHLTIDTVIQNTDNWKQLINQLTLDGLLKTILQQCIPQSFENNLLKLAIDPRQAALVDPKSTQRCQTILRDYFKCELDLHIGTGENLLTTPASEARQQQNQQQQKMQQTIQQDPFVQALQKRFSAKIIPESIQRTEQKTGESDE